MTTFHGISILLADGADRQTTILGRAYKKMGCSLATLNASRLDIGYVSRYPDRKLLFPGFRRTPESLAQTLKKVVQSGDYDVVIPTSDDTAEALSMLKDACPPRTHLAVPAPDLFYMAYDKSKTMRVCMDNAVPCPVTLFGIRSFGDIPLASLHFPIVVKPCMGYGAVGFHRVDTPVQLETLCHALGNDFARCVIQEYIPQTDLQYECAMFVDEENRIKASCVFAKNRWFPIHGGSSTCNVTVHRPDIVASCSQLLQAIHWRGAADIDLIQDPRDGVAKIMEINPRVSGSIKVVINAGVPIHEQILQLALGHPVSDATAYRDDIRLRCIHTDLLWFLKSPNRFRSSPSWFSWKNTADQVFSLSDPLPFFAFSLKSVLNYRNEMEKRR